MSDTPEDHRPPKIGTPPRTDLERIARAYVRARTLYREARERAQRATRDEERAERDLSEKVVALEKAVTAAGQAGAIAVPRWNEAGLVDLVTYDKTGRLTFTEAALVQREER